MLRDLPNLVPVLKDLGAKHAKYGVAAEHYPVVGTAFLKTLKVGLGLVVFTPEVEAAYAAMWDVVSTTMLQGAKEAAAAAATQAPARPAFGAAEVKIIEDTWAIVKTLPAEAVGGLLFKHIFEQADVSSMFPFGCRRTLVIRAT